MATWHTAQTARAQWADARSMDDAELDDLLELAKEQVWQFVPLATRAPLVAAGASPDTPPATVPIRFRVGQLLRAQGLYQVRRGGVSGDGIDGYTVRLYPFGRDLREVLVPPVYGEMVG